MEKPILIHYGSTEYDIARFKPIRNLKLFPKPAGGFWTSPINARFGWKNWCLSENYGEDLAKFCILKFKENAKIYIINKYIDLVKLPLVNPFYILQTVNWEKLTKQYDAVWLTDRGERLTNNIQSNLNLHGWDCESVLVLNPNCIYQINNYENEKNKSKTFISKR